MSRIAVEHPFIPQKNSIAKTQQSLSFPHLAGLSHGHIVRYIFNTDDNAASDEMSEQSDGLPNEGETLRVDI